MMDVKRTTLNGDLEEEVYAEQPEVFSYSVDDNLVYKMEKSTYLRRPPVNAI